ncbi:sporulation peptidase YabG [Sutcliffiella cohnii]|uniref:Sporulation peptidase YabG n=1 Tax=Sutcliffiella cohnii TaxID=33932 RepID=A0A223KX36_9BACI|nr:MULTISPECIES: sporulation peptidase YabG [Sutcliffiella]AST93973.1 sporulation peptidase YabG [Sutcliffiella cohnii]MED4018423.1 sporulation peptidase YabG [Sutcliffiella cohnii]WBL15175.1 sporulation peptidase YabG [Sutcliffiella sp. NC1]
MNINVGDIVARASYKFDLLFRVIDIYHNEKGEKIVLLYGEDVRLMADAPYGDLRKMDNIEVQERKKVEDMRLSRSLYLFQQDYELIREKSEYEVTGGYQTDNEYFQVPGKVLHIDGDPLYLQKCLDLYSKFQVPVQGVHCHEKEMHLKIGELIDKHRPDIIVITGHDAYSKSKGKVSDIKAYRHSRHFVQTVKEARKKVPHLDQLVIFAGACQSHFESLIRAGANFASSPSRVNIHALDPVYIVARICFTPFMDRVNVWDVLRNTLTGEKGLGGIETRGLLRTGMPYRKHEEDF